VLIVDDHPAMRFGVKTLIGDEPGLEICGEAADLAEALRLVREQKPGLMVIDISLNGGSGLELIKQIRALDESIKMLVLTMHDETLYAERVLRAGALGFVNKGEPNERILEAIRRVQDGNIYLSPKMTERLLQQTRRTSRPKEGSPLERVTDRELDVLRLVGQGMTTRQIADHLSVSVKTVETHKEMLKHKLSLGSAAALACFAANWLHQQ
jgi:DNA-binding NarL/FixJ family response regulator